MPATTLQTNLLNDLILPDGHNLVILPAGVPSVMQSCQQAALMRLGENTFNVQEGVDYLGTVFNDQSNYDDFRVSLRTSILNVPDVVDIDALVISPVADPNSQSDDILQYQATIVTAYGLTVIQGETSI
jgi:hypothetical protein